MWLLTACLDLSDPAENPLGPTAGGGDTAEPTTHGACDEPTGCGLAGDLVVTAQGMLIGHREGGFTGLAVAFAGDVDGDGDDDLLVTTPGHETGEMPMTHLVLSPSRGTTTIDAASATDGTGEPHYGWGAGAAGDADGDGRDDVLAATSAGAAALFLDPIATGLDPAQASATFSGDESLVGLRIAGPGEYDDDGGLELLFGDGGDTGPQPYAGFVFDSATSRSATLGDARLRVSGNAKSVFTGYQAVWVGDTDGDGLSEIAFGDPAADFTDDDDIPGQVAIIQGGLRGDVSLDDAELLVAGEGEAYLGMSIAGGHDLDGDGTPDLLVGALGMGEAGSAYILSGESRGVGPVEAFAVATISGDVGRVGAPVAQLGDSDGDGAADVFLVDREGAAVDVYGYQVGWILSGPFTGEIGVEEATGRLFDVEQDGWSVRAVAGGGDMNGDNYGDLVIGNERGSRGDRYAGEVYLLYGGAPR